MLFQDMITPIIDFFRKFIEDSFINFGSPVTSITIADVVIVLFWSIVLSMIIAMTYRGTHRSVSYSQSFTQTIVLIGMIIGTVMLIIGTDIARAFTLVGALSIVRFRTAIKETRDVGFIFFVMAVGMACGTRFYFLGLIVTLVGCGLTYYMTLTKFGQKGLSQDILELNFPTSQDYAQILSPIFVKHLKYYSILGVDSVNESTLRLSFIITFKSKSNLSKVLKKGRTVHDKLDSKAALLSEIQKIEHISNVKIIDGSSSIEI